MKVCLEEHVRYFGTKVGSNCEPLDTRAWNLGFLQEQKSLKIFAA